MEKTNFKKHLVDTILQDQLKVRCKDKHSYLCSKKQEVRVFKTGL
jgi:hypothetical protein